MTLLQQYNSNISSATIVTMLEVERFGSPSVVITHLTKKYTPKQRGKKWLPLPYVSCIRALFGSFGYAKMSLYDRHLSLVLLLLLLASASVDSSPINFQDGCILIQ